MCIRDRAFAQIPYIGPLILMVSIITFAYSTILGWSYYGERAAEYLLGKKAILPYKVLDVYKRQTITSRAVTDGVNTAAAYVATLG